MTACSTRLAKALDAWLTEQPGLVAELARDELADITRLSGAIDTLTKRISERVRLVAPSLVAMPGCGELTAAKIVGEVAVVTRFRSADALAAYAGVTPIPLGPVAAYGTGHRCARETVSSTGPCM